MSQQIISVDSQIVNSIQSCARKTNYHFVRNIEPLTKGDSIERGDLMHKLLEIYYSLTADKVNPKSDIWVLIAQEMNESVESLKSRLTNRESVIGFCREAAPLFTVKYDLDPQDSEETIYQFTEYTKYYEYDSWEILAVEGVASRVIYEDEDIKMIYNGKIDVLAQRGHMIAPWDHKTSKRRQDPSSLSNQFRGYAWLFNTMNVVVNKIGFQKTLPPRERFSRDILNIPPSSIEDWRLNTIWWIYQLVHHMESDNWPMNLTSCDKYSGCIYKRICERSPENREYEIERHYKKGKQWDVAKILESA